MSALSSTRSHKRAKKEDAELDITSFMNLMIVLVPVLLMMMVFSRITVLELNLPNLSSISSSTDEPLEQQILEVEVTNKGLDVYFPQGYLVTSIPALPNGPEPSGVEPAQNNQLKHDYVKLQKTLISIKQSLLANGADKKDIILLLQEDTDYQTIVNLIDNTRSYEDVLVTSVVQAELFPQVSLSDAPLRKKDSL